MAEVIKEAPSIKRMVICLSCDRTIGFTQDDVTSIAYEGFGAAPDDAIICPVCDKEINIGGWS